MSQENFKIPGSEWCKDINEIHANCPSFRKLTTPEELLEFFNTSIAVSAFPKVSSSTDLEFSVEILESFDLVAILNNATKVIRQNSLPKKEEPELRTEGGVLRYVISLTSQLREKDELWENEGDDEVAIKEMCQASLAQLFYQCHVYELWAKEQEETKALPRQAYLDMLGNPEPSSSSSMMVESSTPAKAPPATSEHSYPPPPTRSPPPPPTQ